MRMMHRAALLKPYSLPTFAQLFSRISHFSQGGRSGGTEGAITFTPNFEYVANISPWYLFFTAGASLEISRIDLSNGVMTKTRLRTLVPTGETAYYSEVNQAGTSIVSDPVYSGNMVLLHIGYYTTDEIETMLQTSSVGTLHSYYDATLTNSPADLRVATSKITSKGGVIFGSYRDVPSGGTAASVFYIASTATPTTHIKNSYTEGSSSWDSSVNFLQEMTIDGVPYMVPLRHDTLDGQIARVRSYTLKYFRETW